MLEFQIKELIKARGFKSPYRRFVKAGIGYDAVRGYITGKRKKLNTAHAEILCTLLRCTPNDLYGWTPSQPADDHPDHPLQALRKKPMMNLDEKLQGMSLEEIKKRFGEM